MSTQTLATAAPPTACEIALAFIEAMDTHDFDAMSALCTEDHAFVINGKVFNGDDVLRTLWTGWWQAVPDGTASVVDALAANEPATPKHSGNGPSRNTRARSNGRKRAAPAERAVVHFEASGTHLVRGGKRIDGAWSFPVAVICTLRDGRIAEWREFCGPDTMDQMEALVRAGATA